MKIFHVCNALVTGKLDGSDYTLFGIECLHCGRHAGVHHSISGAIYQWMMDNSDEYVRREITSSADVPYNRIDELYYSKPKEINIVVEEILGND
jgi:hypothetical protein